MGSAKEIQQYLKRFSELDAKRFAVVKVGGAVLRDELADLASSLTFLQQVGLTPIVLHGAGPQLDEELAAAGIEKQTVDGLRVTSPKALGIVRRVFHAAEPEAGRSAAVDGYARHLGAVGRVHGQLPRPRYPTAWSARWKASTWRRSRPACAPTRSR